jgi:hypothetical protein
VTITFRAGKLPPDPLKPRLRLSAFARPAVAGFRPPDDVDWCTPNDWPMYGNDQWGDCVFAGQAHETLARTSLAGKPFVPTEQEVLTQYARVTGFDPADPSTDQGALMQDALSAWRKQGLPWGSSEKIAAFAEVDFRDQDEVLSALYLFGSLSVGLQVPDYALDQHAAGDPWEVQPGGQILGGHAVHLARASRWPGGGLRLWVVTWGSVQEVSWPFWLKFVDEAWCSLTTEWIQASSGRAPSGLRLASLGEQFTALTGEPSPFPPEPPPPDPVPPAPDPEVTTAADRALWAQVQAWTRRAHILGAKHVAQDLKKWAAAKGLTPGGN